MVNIEFILFAFE